MENEELIKQVTEKAEKWLTPAYDAETQAEIKKMLANPDKTDLIEAFYKDLEFGTGGLRGIMGVGSNRMNIYTVGAATQGLSNYLNKNFKDLDQISVVVGHDCRNNSRLFAEISANIFSANGIKVYLFEDMRPTPEMSFAIRHFGCQSGINITASHNPREYNGYKAYWDDGAQVLAPHDKGIIVKTIVTTELIKSVADKNHIEMLDCYTGFKWIAREIRLREGKQQYIGGGEESYGFLAEDFVRDKDAVSACTLLAEICAWAKDQGKTLFEVLLDIYVEYGFSKETIVNVVKPGKSGAEEIKAMMENFRSNPPREIGGSKVVLVKDFKTLKATDGNGNITEIDMPEASNVLQYFTEDGTKISVRPSGTEPKIKFYVEVKGEMGCHKCFDAANAAAEEKVEAVRKSLGI